MDNSCKCPNSGQPEGIGDVAYADSLPDYQHTDHVEPVQQATRSMTIDPNLGRTFQLPTLAVVDRLDRGAELIATPGLDLYERHFVVATHDQIDIAMAAAKTVRNDLPPLSHEPTRRDAFTKEPEILSRFRHGASLSPPSDKSRTTSSPAVPYERMARRSRAPTCHTPGRAARIRAGSSLMMPFTPRRHSAWACDGSLTVHTCVTTPFGFTARTIEAMGTGIP